MIAELTDFKTRRVAAFRKNLVELAELELKHSKVGFISINLMKTHISYDLIRNFFEFSLNCTTI